jgi:carboxyl-terminal processing protease
MLRPAPSRAALRPPARRAPPGARRRTSLGTLRGALPGRLLSATLRAAALAAGLAAAGCGGGGDGGEAPTAGAADGLTEVQWVKSVMTGLYLYADRVGDPDLSQARTAGQALEALRVVPPDRFSYVEARGAYDGFFDEGRALGLGIGYRIVGDAIVLRFVQPDSPAGRAGLRRGDRIASIDGATAASLVAAGRVAAALGPATAGLALRLAWMRDGTTVEAIVAKDWYTVAPVLESRVIERDGRRIGYVALYTFTEPARQAWTDAIAGLRAAGARSLVVDLRENGGGRLFVAAEVAGSLAPAAAVGDVFATLRYNARNAANDQTIAIAAHMATGSFEQVAWLVSDATCSASESLIAGLRPFRADAVIGTPTCGKPVGFNPQPRGDTVLNAVSFASRNRDGWGDWFDGIAPTCTVGDEPFVAFGDVGDPRLAEALHWLATGTCSAAAAAAIVPKAAAPRAVRQRVTGMASETGLH